jgi:hypothetical protein
MSGVPPQIRSNCIIAFMVRVLALRRAAGFLAWLRPYLPAPIQRIALGEMYGGPPTALSAFLRVLAMTQPASQTRSTGMTQATLSTREPAGAEFPFVQR